MILEIIGKVFYFFIFFEIFSKKLIYFLHFENPLFKGCFRHHDLKERYNEN